MGSRFRSGKMRILCVDDEPLIRKLLQRSLGDLAPVDLAASSQEGLEAVTGDPNSYALIVSDNRMPSEDDGVRFFESIFPIYSGCLNPPVRVMVTGTTYAGLAERLKPLGVERILEKPLRVNDLRQIAQEALARYKP